MASRLSKRPATTARVLLRLPGELHRALAASAAQAGLSFNEWCVRRLAAPASPADAAPVRALVVDRARALFGDQVSGVIALGSWVRGEAAAASDIDVLIVLDRDTALTRDLYRRWDRSPLVVETRVVDAHFTHVASAGEPATAAWCEAAVDGLVWYDRTGTIDRRLAEIRRAIAQGRLVRAAIHGQFYWKGVA